jgi:hypothetical protein
MAVRLEYQNVLNKMNLLQKKFDGAVQILCNNGAQKMEAFAKHNRPWHDRTARARQSLKGSWSKEGGGYRIQIAHGVTYGIYLEMKNERRYAILMPTVEKVGYGEIVPAFQNLMDKLG